MPLDFRSRDEDGFSVKRFLKTFGAGVAVFLLFMAFGYYGLGPRITVSEEGRLRLRLTNPPTDTAQPEASSPESNPMPKVVVQEKLPPDVTAGTGVIIGAREVAPFDYERYQQKRRERRSEPVAPVEEIPTDEPPPLEDEYFVPDEPAEPPASEPPAPEPPEPPPAESPQPQAPPDTPQRTESEPQETALYRVQVGVYESRENANQVVQSLIASGLEASVVPFQRDGITFYRVQALVTRDREKAEALKNQLVSRGFPAVVVKAQSGTDTPDTAKAETPRDTWQSPKYRVRVQQDRSLPTGHLRKTRGHKSQHANKSLLILARHEHLLRKMRGHESRHAKPQRQRGEDRHHPKLMQWHNAPAHAGAKQKRARAGKGEHKQKKRKGGSPPLKRAH